MKNVFGLPWKNSDDISGKIQFRIVRQYPSKRGDTCYIIRVYEFFGDFKLGVYIQEYNGFCDREKDVFVLYPRKRQNSSFLEYPFVRHEVNPFWIVNSSFAVMRELPEDVNLDDII